MREKQGGHIDRSALPYLNRMSVGIAYIEQWGRIMEQL